MLTVDIDTGGTMTDALVSDGEARHAFKVDTTPHDYTVSFLACLREAARHFGDESVGAFLSRVGLIRWSSTITTNVLGERRGSKVGLFVSAGNERTLYGSARSPVLDELVDESNVIGLAANPSEVEVLAGVKRLLEGGVRRICVCLADSFPDNRLERAIKETIENQYPDHIIGAVPVLLGSEMAPLRHDQTRVHYSLMNAYTHSRLATSLFKAEDLLRDDHGWRGPLLIGHTSGGVARIGKTKAVDTMESGPVFGTWGGAWMARQYGLENAVCFDVGGTTTKASVVRGGAPVMQRGGELLDVPVQAPLALLRSAVVGGGSIARVKDAAIMLGPESTGAAPGPACYGLGGDHATLTDALLVLGYLDPDNFLGGRRSLRIDAARSAIEKNVAAPLGQSVEAAALSIRDEAVAMMSDLLAGALAEARLAAADTPLFAFGGNGPMFACFIADRLALPAAYTFHLGPVFGAFGSAVSDVVHSYDHGLALRWGPEVRAALAPHLDTLMEQAVRDLRGEGFDPERSTYTWELDFDGDAGIETAVRSIGTAGRGSEAFDAIERAVAAGDCSDRPLLAVRLLTRYAIGSHGIARRTDREEAGPETQRSLRFTSAPAVQVPVYRWEAMKTGQVIEGPAVINGSTLTCPVPPGWKGTVDDHENLTLNRVG